MKNVKDEIKSGALVNFWGLLGKLAAPAFLVLVNRYYGTELFGYYVTANMILDIGLALLIFGFKDGIVIHVSKYAERKDGNVPLYNSIANALTWTISAAFAFSLILYSTGSFIFPLFYEPEFSQKLSYLLYLMIWATPFMAFYNIVISATQGLKIMKYDSAINGVIRPLLLLVFIITLWYLYPGVTGLGMGFLATHVVLAIIGIYVFNRAFNWTMLFLAVRKLTFDKDLLHFALPQNINMTLNRFITGVDVLMLPMFGVSAKQVGYYGAGSMIIREVRNVKLIFSTSFAPHIVRLFDSNKHRELSHHFSITAGWVSSIAIPILLAILVLREELLTIINPEFSGSTWFMIGLLPVPYLYSTFSLAGNVLTMTGHSKVTLANTAVSSLLNVLLNLWLIPLLNLLGAAVASSLTMLALNLLELAEARYFTQTRLQISKMFLPHLCGIVAVIGYVLIFTDNVFASYGVHISNIITLLLVLGIYGLLYFGFRKKWMVHDGL